MSSTSRPQRHSTFFRLNRWIFPFVLTIGISGCCVMGIPFTDSSRVAAIQSVREALDRVHSLEYDHVVSSNFIPESIDLDGNGRSLFETRSITITNDTPFSGMKTIDIIVSWPKSGAPPSAEVDQVSPELDSVRIRLMIDQRYFS